MCFYIKLSNLLTLDIMSKAQHKAGKQNKTQPTNQKTLQDRY